MKPEKKSAPFYVLFAIICCGLLQACALPTWYTGEPDERVLNAERPVAHAPSWGQEKGYPLLSSVPSEAPKDFSPADERAAKIEELSRAMKEGEALRAQEEKEKQAAQEDKAKEPQSTPQPFLPSEN